MADFRRAAWLTNVRGRRHAIALALVGLTLQAALLAVVGWRHRYDFNPDAVAYIRLADEWRWGQWRLAVSGYWGPAFCWLLAAIRPFIADPATAGRVAMAISASAFSASCLAPLLVLGLRGWRMAAAWIVAGMLAIEWSVHSISPDALLSAVLNVSLALLIARNWCRSGRWALATGALLGSAYLIKAVALPLAGLMVCLVGAVRWVKRDAGPTALTRAGLKTALGFVLVAGPWVAVLSQKHHRLTFSTTAAIAHAVVGPHGVFGEHPLMATLHPVAPGRITAWEDPTDMPYRHWRPWESAAAARHQWQLCFHNAGSILRWIARFDLLHVGLITLLLALVPWRRSGDLRWRWAIAPALACTAIYLPVYAENSRYFFPLYAWVLGGAMAAGQTIAGRVPVRREVAAMLASALVLASFAVVAVQKLQHASRPPRPNAPYAAAVELASRLAEFELPAGALAGGRELGMYTALLVRQPWLGYDPAASTDAFVALNADICLVSPDHAVQWPQFQAHPAFELLRQPNGAPLQLTTGSAATPQRWCVFRRKRTP